MSKHLKTVLYKAVLLSMVLGLLGFTIALAASGDLDATFDGDGLVTTLVNPANPGRYGRAFDVAIQTDGKIIAAGDSYFPSTTTSDFAVMRYNTNGSLDTTFSGDGRLITDFGGEDSAVDVAVQSNGKIVVAGNKCINGICDVALARYNPGGALDTTFSGNGKETTDFGGGNGSEGGLAIQSNGKIVVAGYMRNGTSFDFAVYRYLSNGSLDATFSGDGKVNISFGAGRQDFATDLVIQSDGKIVVSGYTADANFANNNFAVARLNKNGSLDITFSGDGRQATNFGADEKALGMALQTDGRIVLAGEKRATTSPFLSSFALARYNTDGSPDTTFNGVGKRVFSVIAASNSWARDVIVQPDGKIVVLGAAGVGTLDYALVRLNSGGGFDTTFSGDGKIIVDFFGDDFGFEVAIQPSDGSYVLSGYVDPFTQAVFGLARVLP